MTYGITPDTKPTGLTGSGTTKANVTSDHMRRWNKLIDFARQKGYAGRMELDHNENLRKKVFEEYNRANPQDAIPIDMVKPIQNEIQNYKKSAIENIKKYPQSYNGNPDNFMSGISKVDGVFGQLTSNFAFPEAYVQSKRTGEKTLKGFAPLVPYNSLTSR